MQISTNHDQQLSGCLSNGTKVRIQLVIRDTYDRMYVRIYIYIYIRHMNFARSNVRIYVKIHDVKLYFKWNLPDPMSDSMSKLMSELMSEYLPECLSEGIYVWSLSEDKKIEDTSENMSEQISEYIYSYQEKCLNPTYVSLWECLHGIIVFFDPCKVLSHS